MRVTVLSIQVYVTLAPMLWQVAKGAGCKPAIEAVTSYLPFATYCEEVELLNR